MKIAVENFPLIAQVRENTLEIWSNEPLRVLSSAVLNGGLKDANGIINVGVSEDCGNDRNDEHWSPEEFLKKHVARLSLPVDKIVGMMTAAKMQNLAVSHLRSEEIRIITFTTAGTSIALTAGESISLTAEDTPPKKCGTINIIVIVDGNLTPSCMVDAVKTITEAKTVALKELDVRSRFSGQLASGTITDSVVIACTGIGIPISYAGTFTTIGRLVGRAVRETTKEAILKQDNLRSNRQLCKRLEERGITFSEILSLATELGIEKQSVEMDSQLETRLKDLLDDQRIASLVLAAVRIDEDLVSELIPESKFSKLVSDTALRRIVQSALETYEKNRKAEIDSTCNCLSDERNYKKLGPSARNVLSAVLREALFCDSS